MLVLTRKAAETIRIGNDIVVKVIKTAKGTVKIGIEAPANIRVMRGELVEDVHPVPSIPSSFGPAMRVVSDQYPNVA
ncbi:MAG: carbon storage regulator [Planctomycetota bacterium]|nr:carbon storage regulator [Planctomycetota bacterium]